MACDCGKPKPGPNGGKPSAAPAQKSLVASASSSSITHVAPDGTKTTGLDLLGARAAIARQGGSADFS